MSDNWNFDGLVQDVLVKSGNNSCCGDISFPDTHKLDNPSNPQSTISMIYLMSLKNIFRNWELSKWPM